jgi:hypothetical protein
MRANTFTQLHNCGHMLIHENPVVS